MWTFLELRKISGKGEFVQHADGIIKLVNCLWTAVVKKKKKSQLAKSLSLRMALVSSERGSELSLGWLLWNGYIPLNGARQP